MDRSDHSRLGTFQTHIEDMRNLSLCKICIKPFYEPFILACGHTYCYSCLASWFGGGHGRKRNKNCPDCRAAVTVQPSPNYLLRDLSHMFVGRAELLPEDETLEEHQIGKREEADLLAADRAGPGLFKGAFAAKSHSLRLGGGILDAEDNVIRCPECHWELEDGNCGQCGFHEFEADQSDSNSDLDSEDMDSLQSGATDYDEDGNPIDHEFLHTMNAGYFYDSDTDRSDDYDHEDDDMHNFINDNAVLAGDDDDSEATMTHLHHLTHNAALRRRRELYFPIPLPYASRNQGDRSLARFSSPEQHDGRHNRSSTYDEQSDVNTNYEEDSGSEVEEDIPAPAPKRRRVQRIVISDDEDDDDDEDDGAENERDQSLTRSEHSSGTEEDDTTEVSSRAGNTSTSISGDEHSSTDSGNEEDETEGDNPESEESDDTAIRPAQSAARRRAFQQSQRGGRVVGRWSRSNGHYNHRPLPRGTRVN